MIERLTAKAALTNFNWSYLTFLFIAILTFVALGNEDGGGQLYALSLFNASMFGLLTGTTLTEIKVKPLSWCMPGQEKAMGPAIVAVAAVVCLLYSALLWVQPMAGIGVPPLQQFLTSFAWSFGVYLAVVACAVYTHDTMFIAQVLPVVVLLLVAGYGHAEQPTSWTQVMARFAGSPMLAAGFAAVAAAATLYVLGSREQSRRLCGAPFLPLKAFDHPQRLRELGGRLRRTSFRPSVWTSYGGTPAGSVLAKLSRCAAGSAWDLFTVESRLSSNAAELLVRLIFMGLIVLLAAMVMHDGDESPLPVFYMITSLAFVLFAPGLTARLSPMVPVSRGQRFRSLLAKSGVVYVTVVAILLAAQLIVAGLEAVSPAFQVTLLRGFAALPLTGVLILGLNGPIHCWGYAQFRSAGGWIVFLIVYTLTALATVGILHEELLAMRLSEILLVTAVGWLPFLAIAWKRCFRDDLLLA